MNVWIENEGQVTGGAYAIYKCWTSDNVLLYVGRTQSLKERLKQHETNSEWFHQCLSVSVSYCNDLQEAKAAEDRAILDLRPMHNKGTNANGPWSNQMIGPKIPKALKKQITEGNTVMIGNSDGFLSFCDARVEKLTALIVDAGHDASANGHHKLIRLAARLEEARLFRSEVVKAARKEGAGE